MSPEDKAATLQRIAQATIEDAMHIAAVGAMKAKKERAA